jgi:hypothetical protein
VRQPLDEGIHQAERDVEIPCQIPLAEGIFVANFFKDFKRSRPLHNLFPIPTL